MFEAELTGANGPVEPRCSAKGCRAGATWRLRWRNPRLHDAAREKTWLACAEHRQQLAGFLSARGFLLASEPLHAGPLGGEGA